MFREIPSYKNYQINESGIVKGPDNKPLRVAVNNDGFMYVNIEGNIEYIQNLIADAYLKSDSRFKYPVHINGDTLNNHISNIKLSDTPELYVSMIPNRYHREYSKSTNIYEVYNDELGDCIECIGRGAVAELIQYEEISLKNMVGNGRVITLGPYKGYQIRRKQYN